MSIKIMFGKLKRRIISFLISFFIIKDDEELFTNNYQEAKLLFEQKQNLYNYQKYILPAWQENTKSIEYFFKNNFSFSFLRNQLLKRTMFAHLPKEATDIQKKLISESYDKHEASVFLKENNTGAPILNDFEFSTSGNSIHHLYHIAKFEKEVGVSFKDMDFVVELGGGYGNFAKLTKRINPSITYLIIDIPVFSYIQIVYLKTVLGNKMVNIFDPKVGVVPGVINILPFHEPDVLSLKATLKAPPDLFVSTWALSESNDATQKLVQEQDYFKAKHLLLAYQKANELFEYAEDMGTRLNSHKIRYNAETEYLKDNYYLFAETNTK